MQIILPTSTNKFLVLIPLVLSAFVHLWNPSGFPDVFYDEGIYMRRAMYVMSGLGPQEGTFHDHPYFGQLFLAGTLSLINYPLSLNVEANPESISSLYAVPRLIMGILAIVDTFLIYKITQLRYGNNVALLAAILFAVMPFTWMTRRIILDSILLPFLLSSILLACYAGKKLMSDRKRESSLLLIFASGAMLGAAIFTKIPSFAAIPLIVCLILQSPIRQDDGIRYNGKNSRMKWNVTRLSVWFIPVVMIPMIWPIHAASMGQFDSWLKDVVYQSTLKNDAITWMWMPFAIIDPVLLVLGAIGIVHAGLKKDYFLLLWFLPFLAFFSVSGYHQYFYVLPIVPALCIASSKIMLSKMAEWSKTKKAMIVTGLPRFIAWLPLFVLVVFGLASSLILIDTNVTSAQFDAVAFGVDYAITHKDTTLAASPAYSWIFPDVFHIPNTLKDYGEIRYFDVDTDYILLFIDIHFRSDFGSFMQGKVYDATNKVTAFGGEAVHYNEYIYPYSSMVFNSEGANIEARIGQASILSPKGLFK
jgi:hypothetical protein